MSSTNGFMSVHAADQLLRGDVFAASKDAGYVVNGRRSGLLIAERIFEVTYANGIVHSRSQRHPTMVKRPELVGGVYPNVPGPAQWDSEPNPDRAAQLWNELYAQVWGVAKVGYASDVQKVIMRELGNGHVFCRTQFGREQGVYITDDHICVQIDLLRLDNEKGDRVIEQVTGNREMVIIGDPKHAKQFMTDYDKRLSGALDGGKTRLQLAYDNVTSQTPANGSTAHSDPTATAAGPADSVVDDEPDDDEE